MNFAQFLRGTYRPICFLAPLPVVMGTWLTSTPFSGATIAACLSAILYVAFANAFNNLIDRYIDRNHRHTSDPARRGKQTVAEQKPVIAWYAVLFLLPMIALSFRLSQATGLLSVCFYIAFWYSYLFGRIQIIKRAVVASCITALSFLNIEQVTLPLIIWSLLIWITIYYRETQHDTRDQWEDKTMKFRLPTHIDWWCISAPVVGGVIYGVSLLINPGTWHIQDTLNLAWILTAIWSTVQIRTKYGQYLCRFHHRVHAGRLGIVVSMTGITAILSPATLIVFWINSCSLLWRSFLPKQWEYTALSRHHNAGLWASIPLIALISRQEAGTSTVLVMTFSGLIYGYVIWHETKRHTQILLTS